MAKARTEYVCRECGAKSVRWAGRCPECQAWNTRDERVVRAATSSGGGSASRTRLTAPMTATRPLRLAEIDVTDFDRVPVGIEEFGRVLGGGIVRGSLVLIGGDPGVGKSTLLAQVCDEVAKLNGPALYISGEESLAQIGLRARRLGLGDKNLLFASETDLGAVIETIENARPTMVVVDSIQSVHSADVESSPGSVSQLRECTLRLMQLAKGSGVSVFLIGHVTKEG